eukprot:EG_transcript_33157
MRPFDPALTGFLVFLVIIHPFPQALCLSVCLLWFAASILPGSYSLLLHFQLPFSPSFVLLNCVACSHNYDAYPPCRFKPFCLIWTLVVFLPSQIAVLVLSDHWLPLT